LAMLKTCKIIFLIFNFGLWKKLAIEKKEVVFLVTLWFKQEARNESRSIDTRMDNRTL
jgi:hypothetical protein